MPIAAKVLDKPTQSAHATPQPQPVPAAAHQARTPATREPVREPARDVARAAVHPVTGRTVVFNRAGQEVSRSSAESGSNNFYVPLHIIPPGWSWEWKSHTVHGKEMPGYAAQIAQVGWEPVMAESYPGVFMPLDYKGPILREGMILMERDMRLTQEAQRDDKRKADERVGASLRKHGKLDTTGTSGVDTSHREVAPVARRSVDFGGDIARPTYDRIPVE